MFERLIKLVRQEKVSLFIGAGFSIEASAPSVRQLKELILNEFDNDEQRNAHANDGLDELTEFFVEDVCGGSRNDLMTLMKKAFEFTPACMDDHKMLAAIPHFHNIFTTNYDTLLEDSFPSNEKNIVRTDKDCAYMTNPTTIFKVHGDFTDPDSVVLTKSDYAKFKKNRPNPQMWKMVDNEFLTKHILFIGYSLEDDNILNIIKTISKSLCKNQKQMFLIAPGISDRKKTQLKKMKVEPYDAVASDFLQKLTKELEENVSDDFRHKDLSPETYARFCHLHKYNPSITINEDGDNTIDEVKSIDGADLEHKFNFTTNSDVKTMLESMDFVKYGEIKEDSPYKNVPCFVLSGEKLLRCSHLVNGVVQGKDFKTIFIGPAEKKIILHFRIVDSDFFEEVQASSYRLNGHTLLIYADCHIFTMTFNVTTNDKVTWNVNFRFDFKKSYSNNDEAIKWIEFPIAFFTNREVAIPGLLGESFTFSKTGEQLPQHNFVAYREYYKNIKYIESKIGRKFPKYNECTEDNYKISKHIIAFLKHEYITEKCDNNKGFSFSAKEVPYNEFNESVKVDEEVLIVSTESKPTTVRLNDRDFQFPYTHYIYNSCIVKGILPNKNGQLRIDFQYPLAQYQVLYSKESADIEFPNLKPLTDIVTDKAKLQYNG